LDRVLTVGGLADSILFRIDCLRACGIDDILEFQPPWLVLRRFRQLTNYADTGGSMIQNVFETDWREARDLIGCVL
jgi:hypothetical protein